MNGINSVQQFWGVFEAVLVESVRRDPDGYALRPEDTAEAYAARTRGRMQTSAEVNSLRCCNLSTPTFKRLARRLGVEKFSQKRLVEVYVSLGGK